MFWAHPCSREALFSMCMITYMHAWVHFIYYKDNYFISGGREMDDFEMIHHAWIILTPAVAYDWMSPDFSIFLSPFKGVLFKGEEILMSQCMCVFICGRLCSVPVFAWPSLYMWKYIWFATHYIWRNRQDRHMAQEEAPRVSTQPRFNRPQVSYSGDCTCSWLVGWPQPRLTVGMNRWSSSGYLFDLRERRELRRRLAPEIKHEYPAAKDPLQVLEPAWT